MDANNRNLAIMTVVMVILVAAAGFLTYQRMNEPEKIEYERSEDVVRIIKVTPEITRSGGRELEVEGPLLVELKDRRKADPKTAPKFVVLKCQAWKSRRPFPRSGRDKFTAEFPDVPKPTNDALCTLTLGGSRKAYEPVFPGDELTCHVDEDLATECEGGAAREQGGQVTVRANTAATLIVDGKLVGPLPQEARPIKIGRREMRVKLADGRVVQSILMVRAEETIDMHFTLPTD